MPSQMCDALSSNTVGDFEILLANCMAHSRRRYVEVADSFPEEVRFVLETLREVYKTDALARKDGLSPEDRLRLHQNDSAPRMQALESWMQAQFAERKVEPNSTLGDAIRYMQNHWPALTLFLRVGGAPLDNNITERALKKAMRPRSLCTSSLSVWKQRTLTFARDPTRATLSGERSCDSLV
jgi:transposase